MAREVMPDDGRRGRRRSSIAAVAVLALLVAPALVLPAVSGATSVRSLVELRREAVVMQAFDLSCGAAAIATLLNYQHGDRISEREVALRLIGQPRYINNPLLVRARFGFSLLDLKRFVDERGYTGIGYGGLDFDDLVEKSPVMVPIRTSGYNHFVIFRGALGDRVLLADPAYGNRTMTRTRFERAWLEYEGLGRVGFIVGRDGAQSPPGRLVPRADDFWTLG